MNVTLPVSNFLFFSHPPFQCYIHVLEARSEQVGKIYFLCVPQQKSQAGLVEHARVLWRDRIAYKAQCIEFIVLLL